MKRNRFKVIGIATSCLLAGSIATMLIGSLIGPAANANKYKDVKDYMLTTDVGSVVTLPIDESPISIVFENLTEEDKNSAIEAIRDLDEVSTNINYKILETDDAKITQKIYIADRDLPSGDAGKAEIEFNNYSGKISYPVYIKLDVDSCNNFISEDTGETALKAVLKHELGHSLGFSDLYNEKYKDESIMWHTLNLEDYTESDKERIRRVYGGEAEKVEISDLTQERKEDSPTTQNGELASNADWYEIIRPSTLAIVKKEKETSYLPTSTDERTF